MQIITKLQNLFRKKPTKIHVFIRYAQLSKVSLHKQRPSGFSTENCFKNFVQNTDLEKVDIHCLLDTFHTSSQKHFLEEQTLFPVIKHQSGTESQSFLFLLEYVVQQNLHPESIVYFLEEDYLHCKNWQEIMFEGFSLPQVDYLTLYDHMDKYTDLYPNLESKIYVSPHSHWRETPSTTNTYAMRMKTLSEDLEIHQKYSRDCEISKDHDKFCTLRKNQRRLVSSLPGRSTHCEEGLMSPCVDWSKEILQTQEGFYDNTNTNL